LEEEAYLCYEVAPPPTDVYWENFKESVENSGFAPKSFILFFILDTVLLVIVHYVPQIADYIMKSMGVPTPE
jgi:hypothetical protein